MPNEDEDTTMHWLNPSLKRGSEYRDNDDDGNEHKKLNFGGRDNLTQFTPISQTQKPKATHTSSDIGYSDVYKGPCSIWVKHSTPSDKPLNIYHIGKIVTNRYKSIIEIKKDGRSKGLILFQNRQEANASLKDDQFMAHGLCTFIPEFKKTRKGVLKGIPTDLKEAELTQDIICGTKVCQVTRINKKCKVPDKDEIQWIPTTSVLVYFEGDFLPKEISLFHVITKVSPYVKRTTQCLKCFKFAHIAKFCRGKQRCGICGDLQQTKDHECDGITPRCANCQGSHKSTSKDCPIFKKYELINMKMAYENLSYFEAKKLVFNKSSPVLTKEAFPEHSKRT
ncbi:hypothetical protein TKK_0014104 [Trichogramma kaykai]|uniref:Uncharacterized protein n=1 Tax=Trichogramma kaykai TaxID=54128 RepID=A0ABD2WH45_9HYME